MDIADVADTAEVAVSAVELFEVGLSSSRLWVQDLAGSRCPLPVSDWTSGAIAGDAELLARCAGSTLDIGCGPGRLVAALAAAGRPALGIDVSAAAIALACESGASALRRSVFGPVPGRGLWQCALLADGNIGIGGDPLALLARTRELLTPDGFVLVELGAPGAPTVQTEIRLLDDTGRASEWFPWARVGTDGIDALATSAGFAESECWESSGRWFAQLSARTSSRKTAASTSAASVAARSVKRRASSGPSARTTSASALRTRPSSSSTSTASW